MMKMESYKEYRKKGTQLLRPYVEGEDVKGVSVSLPDKEDGSPKIGDMIAISRDNEDDLWLVAKAFFEKNYELVD